MNVHALKPALEALLMASDAPLTLDRLSKLLESERGPAPSRDALRSVLEELMSDYDGRGVELVEIASGYRFRTRAAHAGCIGRLWEERRPRYSRALLETLAIIAYRQPITRGEIEHIRGVAVTTNIMRTLLDREWVRVVGHRDVPGRPSVYATTREFLDYFGLKSLGELPSLAELKDFDDVDPDLFADQGGAPGDGGLPFDTSHGVPDGSAGAADEVAADDGAADDESGADRVAAAAEEDTTGVDEDATKSVAAR